MSDDLWTWGGKYFGYREGNDLWTHAGKHVGRFDGDEVYARDGRYLGELKEGKLISCRASQSHRRAPFAPYASQVGRLPYVNYIGPVMYVGYEDFPSPDSFG